MDNVLPPSTIPLRIVLQRGCSEQMLTHIARADYGFGADVILAEFRHNLETGEYTWAGGGNPYECCMLMLDRDWDVEEPLTALFAAWWIGTFLSGNENDWTLINNLEIIDGVGSILRTAARACADLGEDATRAAHAAIPFVNFVESRDPQPTPELYVKARRAFEAIEKLGPAAKTSGRYTEFMDWRTPLY
jgi:hypothetical protein